MIRNYRQNRLNHKEIENSSISFSQLFNDLMVNDDNVKDDLWYYREWSSEPREEVEEPKGKNWKVT